MRLTAYAADLAGSQCRFPQRPSGVAQGMVQLFYFLIIAQHLAVINGFIAILMALMFRWKVDFGLKFRHHVDVLKVFRDVLLIFYI